MAIILDGENLSTGGQVEYFRCAPCGRETFILQLYAETDAVYMGVVSVTSTETHELAITRLTPGEFRNWGNFPAKAVADRVNTFLGRKDFIFIEKQLFTLPDGTKAFGPACPDCGGQMARVGYKSLETFLKQGGNILLIGNGQYRL